MKFETAVTAHVGGREEQQDALAVFPAADGREAGGRDADGRDAGARLVVLADGMGGHAGGSLASQTVIETAERAWSDTDLRRLPADDFLRRLVADAHEAINAAGHARGLSPRSTCVALLLDGEKATWAHVGDSRLYRFSGGALVERTRDHSVVQMLVDMGKIAEEEMGTHPDQNRLTQSLGGDSAPQPDIGGAAVGEGDGFLLCSDGLWERIRVEEMAAALAAGQLDREAATLAEEAFRRGGRGSDNVSVALVRAGAASRPAVAPAAAAAGSAAPAAAAGTPDRPPAPVARGGGGAIILLSVLAALGVGAAAALYPPWGDGTRVAPAEKPAEGPGRPDLPPVPDPRERTIPPREEPPAERPEEGPEQGPAPRPDGPGETPRVPDRAPDGLPNGVPERAPDQGPEGERPGERPAEPDGGRRDAVPDRAPDRMPDPMPDRTPEMAPPSGPDSSPEADPEADPQQAPDDGFEPDVERRPHRPFENGPEDI